MVFHAEGSARLERLEAAVGDLDGLPLLRLLLEGGVAGRLALVSSMGAESAVLLDMVASIDRRTPVIFLDTGKLFAETHHHREELCRLLRLEDVRVAGPPAADLAAHDATGDLHARDPDFCCHLRKGEPLEAALEGFDGWITGRKRFQGGLRADLPVLEEEPTSGRIKVNPLAHWSLEDIRHYRRLRRLPLHPLVPRGYASIGCVPCTRSVAPGEPPRAGRWRGIDKTECGIHRSP